MSAPESHDPLVVRTFDGVTWVRAAVTQSGRGLYVLEGTVSCPEFVMATLAELAELGVTVAPVTELAEAVAALGALPMPVGDPLAYGPAGVRCGCGKDAHSNLVPCAPDPVVLTEQQIDALSDAGNRAVNDHYHEDLCYCRSWPVSCESSGNYFMGTWDTSAFVIGLPAVLALWESMRTPEPTAELVVLRARVAELEAYPLAWADALDAKSLDNFLIELASATEYEPMDGAMAQIHQMLTQWRELVASRTEPVPSRDVRPGVDAARRMIRDRQADTTHDCGIPLTRRLACGHCPHEVCQDCDRCPHTCRCSTPAPGALAEQRHLMDPLDTTLTHLADGGVS